MAPKTEERYAAMREESAARILDAALALFAHVGFDRASVRMIAREAGVAQGLLYNYFDGKEDLLRAIFDRCLTAVRASFVDLEQPGEPAERLAGYIRRTFAIVREQRDFWRLFYSLRLQPTAIASLEAEIADLTAEVTRTLSEHLRQIGAPDPDVRAATLFALIDGAAQHYTLDPASYPLDAVVADVVETYCRPD